MNREILVLIQAFAEIMNVEPAKAAAILVAVKQGLERPPAPPLEGTITTDQDGNPVEE